MNLELPTYKLNHSRPIIGLGNFSQSYNPALKSMVDTSIVEKKRALWDYVVKNDLLNSKDELVRAKSQALLRDKTIMIYNFMKLNGKSAKTRWIQDLILSDTNDRILFCAANQVLGKSSTLDFDASTEFLLDHGKRWLGLLVSGSLGQSQERMANIKLLLDSMDLSYKIKEIDFDARGKSNATQLSIFFMDEETKKPKYTNMLICCPHTSSALGLPANEVFLDEVDFWEDVRGGQRHFINQVLIPRTFETRGRIKCYSNPNGKDRVMFELWNQKDKKEVSAWHRYQFNYWDSANPSQEDFDKKCIGFTRGEIESTLLAVFAQTEGSFFSTDEINDMKCPELFEKGDQAGYGRECAFFLDVGSVHDQSCLVGAYIEENKEVPEIPLIKEFYIHKYPVGYPLGRVVGVDKMLNDKGVMVSLSELKDGWEDESEDNPTLKQVFNEYAEEEDGKKYQPLFGFDATGNAGMLPFLQAVSIEACDIIFSGKRKWYMAQRCQMYVQQRFLKRGKERDNNTVRGCNFDYQMSKMVVKKSDNTVYKQIHHENENDLDDCFDGTIGIVHLIENPDLPSLGFDLINQAGSVIKEDGELKSDEEIAEQKEEMMKDQYIPSFMDKGELNNFIEEKERERR